MNAPSNIALSTFEVFWNLGYRRLVPVIPPGAEISATSSLFKRVGTNQDGRGKIPGVKGRDGKWHSFDWPKHEADELDCQRWRNMLAGVGVKMGDGLYLIDADTLDPVLAGLILETIVKLLGVLPTRIGNWPKAGYLVRLSAPVKYTCLHFGAERVELLGAGRFAVFQGTHPKTLKPYTWTVPLVPFDKLPVFTPAQMAELFAELRSILPAARDIVTEGSTTDISQASLRGDIAMVRKAVAATPNTSEAFPTREAYRDYGYAIKGALPDDEPAAFEIFAEWAERWIEDGKPADPGNDPGVVASDWSRMRPPFRVGANKIYELAEQHAPDQFKKVDAYFEVIEEPTQSLFAPETTGKIPAISIQPLVAGRVDASQLDRLSPRQWLYGTKISRKYVTFLASPGGVGKTAYVIAMALAAASGTQLLHDKPRKPLRVWIYNLEDDEIEIRRRLAAAFRHFGLHQDVLDNVRINSGRSRRFQIVKTGRNGEFIAQPDYRLVIDELKREGIDIFFVDPYLRSHGVSENENEAQDEVMRLYAQIAEEANCGIVLVHHTKKGGASGDMESLRGGSTQGGGARAAYTLAPMAADEAVKLGVPEAMRRTYVRIDDAKNNMAPPSAKAEWLHLESVRLCNGDADYPLGDNVQVAAKWAPPDAWEGFTGSDETAALARISAGMDDGERYSARAQDKERWAGVVLVDMGRSDAQAKEMIAAWLRRGLLEHKDYISEKQRKTRKGLFCAQPAEDGVFA
jgi:hypothetical protein